MFIALSVLLFLTAVGPISYFIDFFKKGGGQVVNEDWYIKFQKSFIAADLWMAACAIVGAIGLLTGQTYGLIFTIITGASLLFLGLMDIAFNIQNNLYRFLSSSGQMKLELLLNILALGLGAAFIISLAPKLAMV